MALILLIEAQTIVREAIRHFLFPEHTVIAYDRWPGAEELENHDLAIVDTETLVQLGQDQKDAAGLAARGSLPVLWMFPPDGSEPEADSTSVFVHKPLDGPAFGKAVRELLAARAEVQPAPEGSETIIELTDVVDEHVPDGEDEPEK